MQKHLLFVAFLLTAVISADADGTPIRLHTGDCLISEVQISEDVLFIQFTGHWDDPGKLGLPATDKNGLSVSRDKTHSETLDHLIAQAKRLRARRCEITVTSDHLVTRGGVPIISLSSADVRLTSADKP